jgi:predicted O-methyltransferase YrrM
LSDSRRVVSFPNWFASTPAQTNFTNILAQFKGKPELNFLQLGAFTGDATVWLLDNILTEPDSYLTDVDTWEGSDEQEHYEMDFIDVESVYDEKTKDYKNLIKVKDKTINFLKTAKLDHYDFIYIDADHTAVGVLLDAELSWLCLKSGGIIGFDDYEWSDGRGDGLRPMPGINTFIDRHKDELTIIQKDWQLWIVKA